jgi:hypothetical protein
MRMSGRALTVVLARIRRLLVRRGCDADLPVSDGGD